MLPRSCRGHHLAPRRGAGVAMATRATADRRTSPPRVPCDICGKPTHYQRRPHRKARALCSLVGGCFAEWWLRRALRCPARQHLALAAVLKERGCERCAGEPDTCIWPQVPCRGCGVLLPGFIARDSKGRFRARHCATCTHAEQTTAKEGVAKLIDLDHRQGWAELESALRDRFSTREAAAISSTWSHPATTAH